nr:reverse transcriptase domain-containing protein [Tanacetum cinerariifolium]
RLIRDQYLEYEDNLDPEGGTFAPAGQVQGGPSPAFVKENINVLRTMIKEVDNRCQEKVTPRKLFNEESGGARSKNSQMSPSAEEVGGYSSDGSSRSSSRVRSEARSRSKSKSVKSKPQSVRASRRKSSSDSGYDNMSDNDSEDLSMPYRQPKPMHFTYRITRFRYHNMNNCYHIKKQIEEVVALGRLAHLVKDIRQGGQRARAQPKVKRRLSTWARRIHVGSGSSLEVMYEHCFRNLSYRTRSRLKESIIPLVGFSGEVDYPLGVIDLEVTMGECGKTRLVKLKSAVVKSPSLYNALLGGLSAECRHALIHTFRKNVDIFVWTPMDMTGFQYKCFLDAYKGYHQIQMTKKDEEKTAFHTEERVFCYTKMPFGLKNARATYQRFVDSTFKRQIGVNLEAYVDDMVIKSTIGQDIIKDVEQTFSTLRRINIKLNPKKCSFDMEEGKFLRYIVTSEEIRVNPEKTKAVTNMPSTRTLKQMQSLSGKLASLNRFLSKSAK